MDEGCWPRRVTAAKVEGQQGIWKPRFIWLDGGEKGFSSQERRLAGGNATCKRKECVERTSEHMIVRTQSYEDRRLRIVGCLYWMMKQLRVWGVLHLCPYGGKPAWATGPCT